jgi:urease accessory protein
MNPLPSVAAYSQHSAGGWRAALRLRFAAEASRTVLAEREHVGPLIVQRPFYPEGAICHVYLVHPPGGIVGGDEIELQLYADAGSHALITTPAATKFYRSGGQHALLSQQLAVNDATLEWLPQESIYYSGAAARVSTRVTLSGAARFIGWEIACYGLPASGAGFAAGSTLQGFEIYRDQHPLLIDRLRIDATVAKARWGLAGFSSCGTLLACPATARHVELVRTLQCADTLLTCTLVDGVLVCRAVASRADQLRQQFVTIWQTLRPALLNCEPVTPRIWAT